MKATIKIPIEIPTEFIFNATKGEEQTFDHPGTPDEVEIVDYEFSSVEMVKILHDALDEDWESIKQELLEKALRKKVEL